jgi:hypothetical protein
MALPLEEGYENPLYKRMLEFKSKILQSVKLQGSGNLASGIEATLAPSVIKDPDFSVSADYSGLPALPAMEGYTFFGQATPEYNFCNQSSPYVVVFETGPTASFTHTSAGPTPAEMDVTFSSNGSPVGNCNKANVFAPIEPDPKEAAPKWLIPVEATGNWTPQVLRGHIEVTADKPEETLTLKVWRFNQQLNCTENPTTSIFVVDLGKIRERTCDPNAYIYKLIRFDGTYATVSPDTNTKILYASLTSEQYANTGDGIVACFGGGSKTTFKADTGTKTQKLDELYLGIVIRYTDDTGLRTVSGIFNEDMSLEENYQEYCRAALPSISVPCTKAYLDPYTSTIDYTAGGSESDAVGICVTSPLTLPQRVTTASLWTSYAWTVNKYSQYLCQIQHEFSETFEISEGGVDAEVRVYRNCGFDAQAGINVEITTNGSFVVPTPTAAYPGCGYNPYTTPCFVGCNFGTILLDEIGSKSLIGSIQFEASGTELLVYATVRRIGDVVYFTGIHKRATGVVNVECELRAVP